MISKHLTAHSFYHTCRYITNKPGAELLIAEGVRGYDHKLMAQDFELQQALRPEKRQACLHAILSFYPGESPSDEKMKEIALAYLKKLNIVNTQYAVTKHTDKAHLHMHIVANMVNNDGKAIRDNWIGLRGKKISQELTLRHQLVPALEKDLRLTHLESLNEYEATRYKIYMAVSEHLPKCRNMPELETQLLRHGIETQYKYKGKSLEKQGISFKMGEYSFKGSQVDRKFSYTGLEKTLALQQRQLTVRSENQHSRTQKFELKEGFSNQLNKESDNLPGATVKILADVAKVLTRPDQESESVSEYLSRELKRRKRKKQYHKPGR